MLKGIALVKLPNNASAIIIRVPENQINKRTQMPSLSTEWIRWCEVHIKNFIKSKTNNRNSGPPTWRLIFFKEKKKVQQTDASFADFAMESG